MADIQQYKRFFDELAPRLETAHKLERELDAHLARRFNAFDYLRTDELGLSRIIADLLNPEGKHGQGSAFLKLLLDGCDLKWTLPDHGRRADVNVEVEKTIKDDRRIDVCVSFGGNCLAIENKPYAGDQPNQVRDYLDWLRTCFENHALIYLSPSGEPPSADSVDLTDLQGREDGGHFKIMPYSSADGHEWEDGFDDHRKYSVTEWLSDCRKNCNVDRLGWFLRETETFCKTRFGGRAVGSSERETIRDFIVSDERKWEVGLDVFQAMPAIMRHVFLSFVPKIWGTWPERVEYEYPSDVWGFWRVYSPKRKSHIGLYRKSWSSYAGGSSERVTQIRLEADTGIDGWYIGVRSDNAEFGRDQEASIKLKDALNREFGVSEPCSRRWIWWRPVEKYRSWTKIIPKIHLECEAGSGEIMMYFAEELRKVAKEAVPIIDRYEITE